MPKKTYSVEFKLQVVNLAQQDNMTISQAARDLGVSPAGLTKWVHQAASHQALGRHSFIAFYRQPRVGFTSLLCWRANIPLGAVL